jgi:putative tricarboxylic transport membrane protein
MTQQHHPSLPQTLVGAGVLLTALALAAGAISIPSAAGYGGIGPNFLPWAVAGVLALCGMLLIVEARTTGFRELDEPSGARRSSPPSASS